MNRKTKINNSLSKLKDAVPLAYNTKFNFGSSEITQAQKDILIKNESIFVKKFKECSAAKYEMCRALYETNLILKENGTFVDWYKSMGMTKDKVYELLNRYKLYMEFTGDKDKLEWVSSLSELAVTYLNRKYVENEDLYEVFEKGLKKAVDIEVFLEDKKYRREIQENNKIEFVNNENFDGHKPKIPDDNTITETDVIPSKNTDVQIEEAEIIEKHLTKEMIIKGEINNSFEKIETLVRHSSTIDEISDIKKLINTKKQELLKFENSLREKEEKLINENQMKLFNDAQDKDLKLGKIIEVMFPDGKVRELIVCKRDYHKDSCWGNCDLYGLYKYYNIRCHDLLKDRACGQGTGSDKEICFKYKK